MDYNIDFEIDFEDRIVDTSEIETDKQFQVGEDMLPLPESIMGKLNRYVKHVKDIGEVCSVIITGCSKSIANDIVNQLSSMLSVNMRYIPCKASEGEMAAILTSVNTGDIAYIQDYEYMTSQLQKFMSDAIRTHEFDFVAGKGHMATSYHLPIPYATFILYTSDINCLSGDTLEGFSIILNLCENSLDLRKYHITRTLKKSGLSADESVIDLLARTFTTNHTLQIKLLEIKSKALNAGVDVITEQLLAGALSDWVSLASIDEMQPKEFEYFVGDLLFMLGFNNIYVTNDGESADSVILAEKYKIKYCIKCQLSKKPIGVKLIKDAVVFRETHKCHIMVVISNNQYEVSAKNLADVSNIVLWDRNDFEEFIENVNQTRE